MDSLNGDCPERRTGIIARDLAKYDIEIAVLNEIDIHIHSVANSASSPLSREKHRFLYYAADCNILGISSRYMFKYRKKQDIYTHKTQFQPKGNHCSIGCASTC